MEKILKAKGIRKILSRIHRITKIPLHRAKVALENKELSAFDKEYIHIYRQVCF